MLLHRALLTTATYLGQDAPSAAFRLREFSNMPSAEICTDNETQAVATGSQRPKTRFDLFMKLLFNEMPWQQKQRAARCTLGRLPLDSRSASLRFLPLRYC